MPLSKHDQDSIKAWKRLFGMDDDEVKDKDEEKQDDEKPKADKGPGFFDKAREYVNAYGDRFRKGYIEPAQEEQRRANQRSEKNLEEIGQLPEKTGDFLVTNYMNKTAGGQGQFSTQDEENDKKNAERSKDMGPPAPDKLTQEEIASFAEPFTDKKTDTLADKVNTADSSKTSKSKKDSGYRPQRLNDKFLSLYDQLKPAVAEMPEGPRRDNFHAELEDLKQQYADAQSDIDKRELIETIAHALGKIGAGAYGLKTHTDLSGVKFDKHDFGADRDRALKENQLGLADLSERRKEQLDQDRLNQEQAFREKSLAQQTALAREGHGLQRAGLGLQGDQLAETIRHNKSMEDVYGQKITAAAAKAAGKGGLANGKNAEELADKIAEVAAGLNKNDYDEATAKSRIETYLMTDLGVSKDKAHEIVTEKGMLWGENLKDPSQILDTVNSIYAAQSTIDKMKSQVPDGSALVLDPDGNPGYMPIASLSAAKTKGYKVLQ